MEKELNYIISNEGNLIVNQARLSDMGNYTCGAINVATDRTSESATLTVYGKLWKTLWRRFQKFLTCSHFLTRKAGIDYGEICHMGFSLGV